MIPRGLHLGGQAALTGVGLDLAYSLIVIALCFFIFFKTKEFVELTDHKGIKWFRYAFLYFGLGYMLRFVLALSHLYGYPMRLINHDLRLFVLIIFSYMSSMAVLSLLYSSVHKKVDYIKLNPVILLNAIALLLIVVVFFFGSIGTLFFTQVALFVLAIIMSVLNGLKSKRKNKFFNFGFTYLLLFLFWILNLGALSLPKFAIGLKLTLYVLSSALFVFITYKVVVRTHVGKNGKKKG